MVESYNPVEYLPLEPYKKIKQVVKQKLTALLIFVIYEFFNYYLLDFLRGGKNTRRHQSIDYPIIC